MKRGLVFLVILSLLLCGQAVQAKEETEWKTIAKVTKKGTTYSLVQNKQSDELYFVKEERVKGKRVEQYRALIGTYEERVHADIFVKKKGDILLLMQDEEELSFLQVNESSGEIGKKAGLSLKNPGGKKGKSGKGKRASVSALETEETEYSLDTPEMYVVTNLTPTSATLKWSEVEGAEKYRIRVDYNDAETIFYEETDETTIVIDDLEPFEVYGFYLQAIGDNGVSEEIMAGVWTPEDIENVSVQSSSTRISLDWSAVERATHYNLFLLYLEGRDDPIEVDDTHFTFDDLEPGKLYGALIDVMDDDYVIDVALVVFATPMRDTGAVDEENIDFPDPPDPTGNLPAPEDFTVEPDQTSARLQWDRVEDAEGYILWINGERKLDLGK